MDFIALKMNIISIRNWMANTDVANEVKCMCQTVITHVVLFFFMNYPLNNSDVI